MTSEELLSLVSRKIAELESKYPVKPAMALYLGIEEYQALAELITYGYAHASNEQPHLFGLRIRSVALPTWLEVVVLPQDYSASIQDTEGVKE